MRLPDINHISPKIYGTEYVEGHQLPPIFSQGTDIVLDVVLNINGQPVLPEDWLIDLVVKKSAYSKCVVWTGELNNGIYQIKDGLYQILIPSDVTSTWVARTYWLDIVITQRKGQGLKDLRIVLTTQPIMVIYTPSSPNPETRVEPDPIRG